eukprot:673455_1
MIISQVDTIQQTSEIPVPERSPVRTRSNSFPDETQTTSLPAPELSSIGLSVLVPEMSPARTASKSPSENECTSYGSHQSDDEPQTSERSPIRTRSNSSVSVPTNTSSISLAAHEQVQTPSRQPTESH